MTANSKSMIIGSVMLVGGLMLLLIGDTIKVPVISLRTTGIVLAVLGAVELVITVSLIIWPQKQRDA